MKGLNLTTPPQSEEFDEQQDYVYGKNMVWVGGNTICVNERGNKFKLNINTPTKIKFVIGILELEKYLVIFSGNNGIATTPNDSIFGQSEIGIYDTETNEYKIVEDIYNFNFNFNGDYPIKAIYHRNFKNEIILAWTDKYNPMRTLNIGLINTPKVTNANTLNDTLIFPESIIANFSSANANLKSEVLSGGSLTSGCYFFTYAYKDNDGTITNYHNVSPPIWVVKQQLGNSIESIQGSPSGILTDKQVRITLEGVDTRYKFLSVVAISVIEGVTSARIIKEVAITGQNVTFSYLGNESYEDISLIEVLSKRPSYKTVYTLTNLKNRIYAGNLTTNEEGNYQSIANNINIKYTTLVSSFQTNESFLYNNQKGFAHGEVYAFYIRFVRNDGTLSRAYHIAGRPLTNNDRQLITSASYGFSNPVPKFMIEDTCQATSSDSGELGVWENSEELYPDEGDFPTGKVRHHKFPSIAFCKANHYSTDSSYGKTKLDVLGIEVSGVVIPQGFQGYEILYAKRDYANATVVGTDITQFAAVRRTGGGSEAVDLNFNLDKEIWTTSGNWGNWFRQASEPNDYSYSFKMYPFFVRLHCFDLMYNNPALSNLYIANELKMFKGNLEETFWTAGKEGGYLQTTGNNHGESQLCSMVVDYTANNTIISPVNISDRFRALEDLTYLPNNVQLNKKRNQYGEACAIARIKGNVLDINASCLRTHSKNQDNYYGRENFIGSYGTKEECYLFSIRQLLDSVYNVFYKQDLVSTNKIIKTTTTTRLFGGDVFIGYNSWLNTAPLNWNYSQYQKGEPVISVGVFAWKRHIAESYHNLSLRYEGNLFKEKIYPYTDPFTFLDNRKMPLYGTDNNNPIQNYSRDYSANNEFITSVIYEPFTNFVDKFPTRVIRTIPFASESQINSWKTWKANDYYEMPKNRGFITNLQSYGERLFIHHQFGLFITRDKTKLEGDIIKVNLGSGDIFDIEPQELIPETGYCGTHHGLSARVTKIGYTFVDASQGKVFVVSDKIEEISNDMAKRFFENYLPLRTTTIEKKKIAIPFTTICVNDKVVFVIPKTKDNADVIPLGSTNSTAKQYYIEFDIENNQRRSHTITMDIAAPDTELAVLVKRSHYYLYSTLPFSFFGKPLEGYIYIDCYVKETKIDYTDNPFKGRGYTLVFDEKYNRLLLTKNNTRGSFVEGNFRGTLTQKSLIEIWQDGDLVQEGNGIYKKLVLTGTSNNPQLYIANNPLD